MNKSDIMKAAAIVAECMEGGDFDSGEPFPLETHKKDAEALIAAVALLEKQAELLKQVEVLPEGSEPLVGDVVLLGGEVERVEQVLVDSYIVESHLAKYDLDCYEAIIQRNGKPVIIDKEGV